MRTKNLLTLFALLLVSLCSSAQTQFWSDAFEDTGSPSVGSRTPSIAEFNCTAGSGPNKGYFKRTNGTDVVSDGGFTNIEGSKFWGFMNLDIGTGCTSNSIVAAQTITWSGINISGKTGLSFKGLFGGNSAAVFQGLFFANSTQGYIMDSMAVEYRIDGGAWTKIVGIYPNNNTASGGPLAVDNNNDRVGDGTALTSALSEVTANITGTGTTLDLRFDIFDNNSSPGSMAIDNFRLFAAPACNMTASLVSQTNVSCNGGSNGAATVSAANGTGTLIYNWTPGNPTGDGTASVTGLSAGNYSVLITDANNCTATQAVTITQPAAAVSGSTVVTNVACFGGTTGAINLTPSGGTGPYTFNWGSGITTEDRTGLAAGSYSVTITDANSCTGTVSPTITQPAAAVSGSTVVTNVACFGGTTGAINLTPSGGTGPYTFNWGGGITTEDRTGLAAGSYSVTITDANSCTGTVNPTITQPAAAVSGSTVVTNVACFGGTTGAINLTPSGGTGPYTFNWGGGITTEDRTGLAAGSYSVTITDANSCTGTVSPTITQPAAAVSGSTVVTNVACFGGTTGAINLTPSGGTGPYTFNWGGGITTEDRTGLAAGSYSVTITDANSCTGTVNPTITQPAAAVSGSTVVTNVACFGGTTGAINLTPSGGTGPYTFNWGGGITTEDRTGLAAGSYSVTITDANSCTGTVSPTITQPAAAVSGSTVVTNVACFGGTTGAINLTPSGGTGPYTFNWGGGITTEDRTGLAAGSYSVTITDANSCTGTVSPTITQPAAAVSGSTVVTNVACFGGTTGAINLTPSGGTGPYTFNWGGGITTEDRTGLAAGSYSVTITDANSCTGTVSPTITQPAAAVSGSTVVTNVACFGGTTGAINLTPSGGTGPYTFNWGSGITTEDRTGLAAGSYSVTITDANSCTGTVSPTITQPAAAVSGSTVVTNVACFGGTTGAINLTPSGGTGPYTFNWGGGITTEDRTGLAAGSYSVTITDANSCTGTVSPTITQPAAAVSGSTVVTNVACFGGTTGAINLTPSGGTGPYTFNWGGGITTEDRTGLAAGSYSVTITDANSCTGTVNPTITQPAAAVSGSTVVTNVACFGGTTGAINLTPSGGTGPYTFNWGGGITTEDRTGLAAGSYSVTITDANSCTGTVSPTITQPAAAVSGSTVVTNVACFGGTTGAINLTPSGGTGPYTFNWGGGITTEDRTGLAAGSYSVTITDANSCTGTVSPTITQPAAAVSGSTVVTNVACFGGTTGAINLTPSGGTGPYTFNWGGGITTEDRTGLAAGSYSVTITDANSCTGTVNPTVAQPTALNLTVSADTNICVPSTININASATGGTGTVTYNWTPGNLNGGTQPVSPTVTTNYIVTATDANNCTRKDTVIVSVGGVLAQSNQSNTVSVDGDDTSSNNVVISGLTYLYNDECKTVASVKQNAALGTILGYVTVVDSVPVYQGRPFAPRWYQITPQNNGAGSVNLYFTQQDFDDYNVYATAHSFPKLPQNPTDQVGIDSLVITKVSGGDLMAGTGTRTLIYPDSVKWNASLHFWTVSLTVPSFSQFFVHTNNANSTPLYVNISSFNVKNENGAAGLYWTTQTEIDNAGFDIQRSMDGKVYQTIGAVASKAPNGNSRSELSYSFNDRMPFKGMNFYRLAEKDQKGNILYSDVRMLNFDGKASFNCYPNPVRSQLVVEYNADKEEAMSIHITDVMGKIVMMQTMNVQKGFNKSLIDMSSLAQGMYSMTIISNSGAVYTSKVTKE